MKQIRHAIILFIALSWIRHDYIIDFSARKYRSLVYDIHSFIQEQEDEIINYNDHKHTAYIPSDVFQYSCLIMLYIKYSYRASYRGNFTYQWYTIIYLYLIKIWITDFYKEFQYNIYKYIFISIHLFIFVF